MTRPRTIVVRRAPPRFRVRCAKCGAALLDQRIHPEAGLMFFVDPCNCKAKGVDNR